MNEVYEWVLHWVLFHLDTVQDITTDDIFRITEDTLRDYDMEYPDTLSDNDYDDLFVGVSDTLISRYGFEYQEQIPIDFPQSIGYSIRVNELESE